MGSLPVHAFSPAARLAEERALAYARRAGREEPWAEEGVGPEGMRSRNYCLCGWRAGGLVPVREEGGASANGQRSNVSRARARSRERRSAVANPVLCGPERASEAGSSEFCAGSSAGGYPRAGRGIVESYPIDRWLQRTFGNESTGGTESMFAKAGFRKVALLGSTRFSSHVLMRRKV